MLRALIVEAYERLLGNDLQKLTPSDIQAAAKLAVDASLKLPQGGEVQKVRSVTYEEHGKGQEGRQAESPRHTRGSRRSHPGS